MRIYISGPMTGHSDLNRPAFDAAEKRLTAQGHFVINPRRISKPFGTAEEQEKRFHDFCRARHLSRTEDSSYCAYRCPLEGDACCEFAWAQMPYEEGGAK